MAEVENKELREFMEVLHEALAKFIVDPQRNRRSLLKVMRHIEERTGVKPFVELKK
jgi:hypothetical protein